MTGPAKPTSQTPNLRRYDWMSRVWWKAYFIYFFNGLETSREFMKYSPASTWNWFFPLENAVRCSPWTFCYLKALRGGNSFFCDHEIRSDPFSKSLFWGGPEFKVDPRNQQQRSLTFLLAIYSWNLRWIIPPSLTARPWKMVVGRRSGFLFGFR